MSFDYTGGVVVVNLSGYAGTAGDHGKDAKVCIGFVFCVVDMHIVQF